MSVLKVVGISGESFDLESGQEVGKTITVTNGAHSCQIEVKDDDIAALLLLYRESVENTWEEAPSEDPPYELELHDEPEVPPMVDDLTGVVSA